MQLLELEGGQASLELNAAELGGVIEFLRGIDGFRRRRRASHELLSVGDSKLILTNDWDEPCLLSSDANGTDILRAIAFAFGSSEDELAAAPATARR
jgi:hypothetical protein